MCVSLKCGLVIAANHNASQLNVFWLVDGSLLGSFGDDTSECGRRKFEDSHVCVSHDGNTIIVSQPHDNRLQEVRILGGKRVRLIGADVLEVPQAVDCNADVIVVAESASRNICVLSWIDGEMRARFAGGWQSGLLASPMGLRLLADGNGFVVTDVVCQALSVFSLCGDLVSYISGRKHGIGRPSDVLEDSCNGTFTIADESNDRLVQVSRYDDVVVSVYGKTGHCKGEFRGPVALAALPNDACLVLEMGNHRAQHLVNLGMRVLWMRVCAHRGPPLTVMMTPARGKKTTSPP